jgi:hypothetical protein
MIFLAIAGIIVIYGAVKFDYIPYNKYDYYNYGEDK